MIHAFPTGVNSLSQNSVSLYFFFCFVLPLHVSVAKDGGKKSFCYTENSRVFFLKIVIFAFTVRNVSLKLISEMVEKKSVVIETRFSQHLLLK